MDTLLENISVFDLQWFVFSFMVIVVGNVILRRFLEAASYKKGQVKKGVLASVSSLLNWASLYLIILLFLLYFSKSEWLFYPLYSRDQVDVSLFLIIVAVMIVSLAHRLIKLVVKYALTPVYDHYGIDKGLGYTFNQVLYYTVMLLALGISFTSVGLDLTAFGAIFGVLGIGIGFGMRNIAGNFVSGIIILFERPIEVGEVIQIDQKIGQVEKIRLRSTVIRTAKEGVLIVPNQYFIEQIIKNRTSAKITAQVTVSVEYGTDTQKVDELLNAAVEELQKKTDGLLKAFKADVRFVSMRNSSLDFFIEIPVANFEVKELVESRLRHCIVRLFMDHHVKLASPANQSLPGQ